MTCQPYESPDAVETNTGGAAAAWGGLASDESRLSLAMKELKSAGWYWGNLSANEAKEILRDAAEGTFLVRDSSQSNYLFTISAVTSAGPTNLRIEYDQGKFKLDSVLLVRPRLKQFDSVVHLVDHYFRMSLVSHKTPPSTPSSSTVPLLLTRPAYAAITPLQHLCRVTINRHTRRVRDLPLPNRLKDYVADYAYHV
ncbi:LOW QUALITY PROTEIN: suppressor of cytokine signaling 2-like [Entelurus aequoreus]|uniref:LOW QUALITY PROTEIN: suppressor of cytokine signaling 2-like n=1 Tax=Entelurus aequoreus TaxID=161455 RepID=UPI002B1D00E8|nr:LOW QUALITY PROTEIN: suppressor of cytokine signaling 2-like [Entelurus aequoreus]